MLRQVLTPTELRELGLDVAVHSLPQSESKLNLNQYMKCRSFLLFSWIVCWGFGIWNCLSQYMMEKNLFSSPITLILIFLWLLTLSLTEFLLTLHLSNYAPCNFWDFLGLVLSLFDRLVFLCDILIPVIAWKQGFSITTLIAFIACGITYIFLFNLQQLRLLMSLYKFSDNYTVQEYNFIQNLYTKEKSFFAMPLKLFYWFVCRKMSCQNNQIVQMSNIESFNNNNDCENNGQGINYSKLEYEGKDCKVHSISKIFNSSHSEKTANQFNSINVLNRTLYNNVPRDANMFLENLDSQFSPPELGSKCVYNLSYRFVINMLYTYKYARQFSACCRIKIYQILGLRNRRSSMISPPVPSVQENSQPVNLLIPFFNSRESMGQRPNLLLFIIDQWLANYEIQSTKIVEDYKTLQLTNAAFFLHCLCLQSCLRRIFLPPDCIEAHEFSVACVSLGRCFIGDTILNLLKFYLLLSWSSYTIFLIVSLSLSILQSCIMCLANTIDSELIQDIFTFE